MTTHITVRQQVLGDNLFPNDTGYNVTESTYKYAELCEEAFNAYFKSRFPHGVEIDIQQDIQPNAGGYRRPLSVQVFDVDTEEFSNPNPDEESLLEIERGIYEKMEWVVEKRGSGQ